MKAMPLLSEFAKSHSAELLCSGAFRKTIETQIFLRINRHVPSFTYDMNVYHVERLANNALPAPPFETDTDLFTRGQFAHPSIVL